jgi:hypothetical protein
MPSRQPGAAGSAEDLPGDLVLSALAMKWLKIGALVLLVLVVMRLASWALGWGLARFFRAGPRTGALVSNAAACLLYIALLYRDLMPGEPLDTNAVLFGLAVFTVYAGTDLFWTPWKRTAR